MGFLEGFRKGYAETRYDSKKSAACSGIDSMVSRLDSHIDELVALGKSAEKYRPDVRERHAQLLEGTSDRLVGGYNRLLGSAGCGAQIRIEGQEPRVFCEFSKQECPRQ